MELTGKVIKAFNIRKGTSATSGKEWQVFEFILEMQQGEYKRHAKLQIFGEDKIKEFGKFCDPRLDKDIVVSIDIDAKEFKGSWYNSLNVWKIKDAEEVEAQPLDAEPSSDTKGNVAEPQSAPTNGEATTDTNQGDDLPF